MSMQAHVAEQPDAAHRSAQRPADGHHRLAPRPPEPSAAGTPSANAGSAKVLQPVAPPLTSLRLHEWGKPGALLQVCDMLAGARPTVARKVASRSAGLVFVSRLMLHRTSSVSCLSFALCVWLLLAMFRPAIRTRSSLLTQLLASLSTTGSVPIGLGIAIMLCRPDSASVFVAGELLHGGGEARPWLGSAAAAVRDRAVRRQQRLHVQRQRQHRRASHLVREMITPWEPSMACGPR